MIRSPRSLPRRAFAAALLLLAASCGILEPDPVRIRVRNATGENLEGLVLYAPIERRYGNLAPGETSGYRRVGRGAYYIGLDVVARGAHIRHIPRDNLGAERLDPGSYTYELTPVTNIGGDFGLATKLVRD
jgi:hypothetical protein